MTLIRADEKVEGGREVYRHKIENSEFWDEAYFVDNVIQFYCILNIDNI